jgi:hypothetical protein
MLGYTGYESYDRSLSHSQNKNLFLIWFCELSRYVFITKLMSNLDRMIVRNISIGFINILRYPSRPPFHGPTQFELGNERSYSLLDAR